MGPGRWRRSLRPLQRQTASTHEPPRRARAHPSSPPGSRVGPPRCRPTGSARVARVPTVPRAPAHQPVTSEVRRVLKPRSGVERPVQLLELGRLRGRFGTVGIPAIPLRGRPSPRSSSRPSGLRATLTS